MAGWLQASSIFEAERGSSMCEFRAVETACTGHEQTKPDKSPPWGGDRAVRSRPQLRSSWKLIAAGTERVSFGEGRGLSGLTVLQRETTHLRVYELHCLSLTSLNKKKRTDLSR